MQILITSGSLAKSRVLRFNRWQLSLALVAFVILLTLLSGLAYHYIFLKAAREGWPVVSQFMRLIAQGRVLRLEKGQAFGPDDPRTLDRVDARAGCVRAGSKNREGEQGGEGCAWEEAPQQARRTSPQRPRNWSRETIRRR